MNNDIEAKKQLAQLYAQKGELITNIEIEEQQLKIINKKIYQLKASLMESENKSKKPKPPSIRVIKESKDKPKIKRKKNGSTNSNGN